ncbi:MAG: GlsB/YeaQ/YmgE family stress response membrane protein [Anaerolineales bacterium]|nr:GlsB/YeaQ/YmgE family stress response membrane protein [Anaerolineales bacterium]
MDILSWIIVGLIAGWLAGAVMKGGGYGVVGDIIIGIVGAIIGGYLATTVFGVPSAVDGINFTSIFVAFLGAVLTIAIARALSPRTSV